MPQPTREDVHVDAILTNISVAYRQKQENFIASKVFPFVPVEKESDKYYVYTKNDWFRDEAEIRGDSEESAGSGYNLGTDSYSVDIWAFHKDVGDRTRRNSDNPLSPDRDASEFVTSRLLLRQEIQWASDYFTTGVWDTDATLTNKWSDYVNGDPFDDIDGGKQTVLSTTGYEPNTLVLGYLTWRKLKRHPDLREQLKYTSSENISTEIAARMFEIDNIYVCKAIKATNVEGGTAAYDFVFDNDAALLCYVNPQPALLAPSAGYIFAYTGVSEGMGETIGTSRIRMDTKKADRIEAEVGFDDKVVASDLGWFVGDAVD